MQIFIFYFLLLAVNEDIAKPQGREFSVQYDKK